MKLLQKHLIYILVLTAILFGGTVSMAQTQTISVSVREAKVERGQTLDITIKTQSKENLQVSLLKPTVGTENLPLQKNCGRHLPGEI